MSNRWSINKNHYNKLLSYIGCGDFTNADILIFGNEEGLGGLPIEPNIEARTKYFGRREDGTYEYALNDNWEDGYWEPSGITGRDKIIRYIKESGMQIPNIRETFTSPFLTSIARINMALHDRIENIDYWFQPVSPELKIKIEGYIKEKLFQPYEAEGVKTALMDWRHLSRPDQQMRYDSFEEYKDKINHNLYMRAFSLKQYKRKKVLLDDFTDYEKDSQKRLEVLKNAIITFQIPIVLSFGLEDNKYELIKSIFPDIEFKDLYIQELDNNYGKFATTSLGDKEIHFFIVKHPGARFKQGELYQFLKYLTKDYLFSIYQATKNTYAGGL